MKITQTIPVVFHNLKGYDSHLIIKELAKFDKKINVIPLNMQKYLSFEVSNKVEYYDKTTHKKKEINVKGLRFIDSFGFMNESLSSLVDNLKASCTNYEKFNYLSSEFKNKDKNRDVLQQLTRKGVYPYSYMSDFSKFEIETSKLKKEDFKNDLNDTDISDEDYSFYNKVCKDFNLKTMKDYHDLYLKTDVLLLADVFENFRLTCYKYYELDPLHYYSAPGLAWDACLKKTKIELELLSDVDMNLMIDKGCRGGMSIITQRYAKANNKYMGDKYNKNEESSYIEYLDANALYSWAMTQPLPYSGFKWIDPNYYKSAIGLNISDNNEIGHILEVDLEYPKELHDAHNEYPFCCEHINIQKDELSDYASAFIDKFNLSIGRENKLISNLNDKNRYVIHEKYLKQALDAGLKLKKIHRVIQFKQKPWMKEFIDFNTIKRQEAKNKFEKDFFKLLNNATYGRTLMNVKKQQNIQLVNNETDFLRLSKKPNYISSIIFSKNLVGVELTKEKIKLNQPKYVGFSILDLSKYHMYNFHYGYIKKKYDSNARLLFTDTDSLCYHVKTDDFYKDMIQDKQYYDLSDMKIDRFKDCIISR